MDKEYKIGVVGAGATGGVIATMLAHAGYDVEITKPRYDGVMIDNRINLEIHGAFGDISYLVPFVEGNSFTNQKDVLFICTKAYSVLSAISDTKKYLKPNGVVVVLQNVVSVNDVLKVVEPSQFIPLVLDWVSKRENTNEMYVLNAGNMHIGALNSEGANHLPALKNILCNISNTVIENNVYSFMLSRFLLFCNTSCMGALTGYNLGTYLKQKQAQKIFINLIREQLEILMKQQITVPAYDNNLDYYKFAEHSISGAMYRRKMFKRLIKQNGENVSQTLRNLETKHKTELDYLCNHFANLAKTVNVNAPYNTVMTEILAEIENGQRSIIIENINDERFLKIRR